MKKLKNIAMAVVVSGAGLLGSSKADALIFTLADYTVSLRTVDPGLVLYATDILANGTSWNLNPGGSIAFDLFRVGTNETSIDLSSPGDTTNYPISVSFLFSAPAGNTSPQSASGTSDGLFLSQSGRVDWTSPANLSFGTGGAFSVSLSDVSFGTPGSAVVRATLSYTSAPTTTTVPEPTSLALLGLGLAGLGLLRRKRTA